MVSILLKSWKTNKQDVPISSYISSTSKLITYFYKLNRVISRCIDRHKHVTLTMLLLGTLTKQIEIGRANLHIRLNRKYLFECK